MRSDGSLTSLASRPPFVLVLPHSTSMATMSATAATPPKVGSNLPAVKWDSQPLPPVDLNSEDVLGGEESDEALSSDVRRLSTTLGDIR
jgi:hypothetical protein